MHTHLSHLEIHETPSRQFVAHYLSLLEARSRTCVIEADHLEPLSDVTKLVIEYLERLGTKLIAQ